MKPGNNPVSRFTCGFICLLAVAACSSAAAARGPATQSAFAFIPPTIAIDSAFATGAILRSPGGIPETITVQIHDSLTAFNAGLAPRDTVPANSRLEFRWHSEVADEGYPAIGYEYKLDEAAFVAVDSSVRAVSYNTGVGGDVIAPGLKVFRIRVHDSLGRTRETNRRFLMNYGPETWFAGPDTTLVPKQDPSNPFSERFITVPNWSTLAPQPGSGLSCDSITVLPSLRAQRKSFFEIYQNRLYVHSEGDTVRMNSWVLFHGGGSDLDSPYGVIALHIDPAFPDTTVCPLPPLVLTPAPPNGSPIGFHGQFVVRQNPANSSSGPAQTGLFPRFDPNSPLRNPVVGWYQPMFYSGKVYALLRAEDGDGLQDRRVINPQAFADSVDAGHGTPEMNALRSRVMTLYVDKPPRLLLEANGFVPRPGQAFSSRHLNFNLLADDEDPFDPDNRPPFGGPSTTKVFRWTVWVKGKDQFGGDIVVPSTVAGPQSSPQIVVDLPDEMTSASDTVLVELCDCWYCEIVPGSGRCVNYQIPIEVPPVQPTPALASLIDFEATPARVHLRWMLGSVSAARVERRTASINWIALGDVRGDGSGVVTFDDASVVPGASYAYRLSMRVNGESMTTGESWVDVPRATEFALQGLAPNPSSARNLTVRFSLASSAPARLEVLDTSGRRWIERDLGSLEAGAHSIALGAGSRIPPGVYLIRLAQGNQARVVRAVVVE